jgi:hypothetical protein
MGQTIAVDNWNPFFTLQPSSAHATYNGEPEDRDMQYVLFGGIFGLPVAVCLGLLALKVLDTFASDDLPAPARNDAGRLHEIESREDALVDSFFHPPAK